MKPLINNASQLISAQNLTLTPHVRYRVCKKSPLKRILSLISLVCSITFFIFKSHFHMYYNPCLSLQRYFLPAHMSSPFQCPRFGHLDNILSSLQNTTLLDDNFYFHLLLRTTIAQETTIIP